MRAYAPALYITRVMHLRMLPERNRKHQFRYSVFRFWLDVDQIERTISKLKTIGHNRFNLFGFYERDHGPRDGTPLRPWVEAQLAREGVATPARIMLYCLPRVFGYEFNPLAMYCAYDADDRLIGVVYQVRNTDGDLSPYVANIEREGLRHGTDKNFYVSPFIDADQRYGFTLRAPEDTVSLRIKVDGPKGLTMIATEVGETRALTDAALLKLALLKPLMSFKITLGIYFEAVRLRIKGAPFFKHPGNRGLYASPHNFDKSSGASSRTKRPQEVRESS